MSTSPEPILATRPDRETDSRPGWLRSRVVARIVFSAALLVVILVPAAFLYARHWVRDAVHDSLPQLDGSLSISGLSAPVTVDRDAHGIPHIRAANMDDLVFAQGFVTAQDRLFQLDILRRHAAGELAEVLGQSVVGHDRLQRTLQIRATADRALGQLPPNQLHLLEQYAAGVNASIAAQSAHLPVEFRVLRYTPAPWTPRDSLLILLVMFQDLTSNFPEKLARESLTARLPADLRPQLEQDLYPVGSWRDHPPTAPIPDLTIEGPPIEDVPLDETQSHLDLPALTTHYSLPTTHCPSCIPGSNNWAVSGAHTASGKPLLSNDMHLSLTLPGIWYEADLEAPGASGTEPFHAAGVTLPGLPLIVVGHNDHIAWGLTNLGADVQDIYIETTRGNGASEEFQAVDGTWQPVVHLAEPIKVKGGKTILFEVLATRHGDAITPILNPALTADATKPNNVARTLSLRWVVYEPGIVQVPSLEVDSAHDWPSLLAAFRDYGGPAQNLVYADDKGHIGYHMIGKIPLRGPAQAADDNPLAPVTSLPNPAEATDTTVSPGIQANANPLGATQVQAAPAPQVPLLSGPLSPVPLVPSAAHEWSGYIPFDELAQIFDPPAGVIATANARTAPDDFAYPVTLNWGSAYRTERIYRRLTRAKNLRPADMLALENDIYSDFDKLLAERLTYALDHSLAKSSIPRNPGQLKTLHQAADILRTFDGHMTTNSAAASILASVHTILWPMLLEPRLSSTKPEEINTLYQWGERDYALEQILTHQPPRWLPSTYPNWNDFLAAAVLHAITSAKAPLDLSTWHYGSIHTIDIEHPIFDQSEALRYAFGRPTGTGPQPLSGDGTTVKQVGRNFGPSERFTADFADLNKSTLNIVLGQSGNPDSPYFLDQFPAWLHGTTFILASPALHTLTLTPR
jgi:penicillin amidase